jgi:group II intron reverse transcriptase/maturase
MVVERRNLAGIAGLAEGEAVHTPDLGSGCSDLSASAYGSGEMPTLWLRFLEPANLSAALKRVQSNKGAAGIDGMTTAELRGWLFDNWLDVHKALDEDTYRPQPVRRVVIPKPGGGERLLGVPTVLDRFIQQALAQVLMEVFEPTFSPYSFGFRPGRSAHQAVEQSKAFIEDGYRYVVDLDLEKFFDRVNHDALMARVARKVEDKKILKLVRRFLNSGVMVDGVKQAVEEGTPQGSPLSPLLSNIMLDDLDRELTDRGLRFVRYADDLRVFLGSRAAADRVMGSVTTFVEKRLKLKVNREKSSVQPAARATLLGFGFFFVTGGLVKIRVAPKAIKRLKERMKVFTGRSWSCSMQHRLTKLNRFIRGWMAYFRIADTLKTFEGLDKWYRRRMRQIHWKQWKRIRTRIRMLRSFGIRPDLAFQWGSSSRSYWRIAKSPVLHRALPNSYFDEIGLVTLSATWKRFRQTI